MTLMLLPAVCDDTEDTTLLNYDAFTAALKSMQRENPNLIRLSSLCKSAEDRDVWVIEVGAGNDDDLGSRPGMLVVAGIEGDRPAGTQAVLAFLRSLCASDETSDIQRVLENTTIYTVPRLNPDGVERYFMQPQMEFATNTTPFDADHDGFVDEDGPDDLNDDGLITSMRIEDPEGGYIEHPDAYGIMIEADPAKGEHGRWRVLSEGTDNDKDEELNEDQLGGVNFNKNFPFDYPWFDSDAGIHQISTKGTRALADFVIAHPNTGIVMSFVGNSTLLKKPDSADQSDRRKPQEKIRNEDVSYYDEIGKKYRECLNIGKDVETDPVPGSFVDWIYFHRGRLSLSAPLWNPDIALAMKIDEKDEEDEESDEKSDEPAKKDKETEKKKKKDDRAKTTREYLKWIEEHAPDRFRAWTAVDHPDYPDRRVEVGGFSPYAMTVPPDDLLPDILEREAEFLVELAKKMPRVIIENVDVEHLGEGVYELVIRISNEGYLPTVLAHGERTGEVLPTRLEIDIPQESVLAGRKEWRLGAIEGGEVIERRCIARIQNKTTVKIELISALAGQDEETIQLGGK